jgi:hypothetical protein
MYHLVRIFYNKEELNIIIIKISKKFILKSQD